MTTNVTLDTTVSPKTTETRVYGQHLTLDCYGANSKKLHDIELLFRFLDTLPEKIGMQKIGPPQMACFDEEHNKGITGIVMIVTSHISIHTYSNRNCFFMDVFSCEYFNAPALTEYIKEYFDVAHMEANEIVRGRHFPKEVLSE